MVGLISSFFGTKRRIAALEKEVKELQGIIITLLPHSEKYLDLIIDGQVNAAKLTEFQKRLGMDSKIAYAGVA